MKRRGNTRKIFLLLISSLLLTFPLCQILIIDNTTTTPHTTDAVACSFQTTSLNFMSVSSDKIATFNLNEDVITLIYQTTFTDAPLTVHDLTGTSWQVVSTKTTKKLCFYEIMTPTLVKTFYSPDNNFIECEDIGNGVHFATIDTNGASNQKLKIWDKSAANGTTNAFYS